MIRRVVLWRLKAQTDEDKQRDALKIKQALETMRNKIPGMISITVGINTSDSADASDVVMQVDFSNQEALEAYESHPEHEKVKPVIGPLRDERRVVEYEI
ncbi:Dabb family protein [Hahella ganghwensis]|uniref:Dabb family protein n=1 Tax=Hahella ganghwensis TaxID=286420 RepID=UPI00036C3E5F|nr:Dabb family protein [Hahella ganghwensis]